MKKFSLIKMMVLVVLALPITIFATACGDETQNASNNNTNTVIEDNSGNGNQDNSLQNFADVVFANRTVDYDGQEHSILVNENVLPEGVNVSYSNNVGTNAGEYNASVTLTKEGYNPLTLTAKLTINKINYDMSNAHWTYNSQSNLVYNGSAQSVTVEGLPQGVTVRQYTNNSKTNAGSYTASVTFAYDTTNYNAPTIANLNWQIGKATYDMSNVHWSYSAYFTYNGVEKEIVLQGLPNGVTARYTNNRKTEVGTYTASVVLIYDTNNYNTISVDNCVWKILPDLSQLASSVLNSLMRVPDPWEFLPQSLALENKVYNGNTEIDFTNFVSVSSLPKCAMGKQMNVVYSTLLDVDDALSYLRYIYGSMNIMVDFYQTFINSNPENYASYEKQTDNFTFKILLDNNDYKIYISYNSVAMELSYDTGTQNCYGRIQLTNSNVIKYEMSEDSLTVAVKLLGLSLTQLHFERASNEVNGYLYEFYGTENTNIKTSALIKVDESYTSIISNKRETDDLSIEGYMEVYNNTTGNLIGAEVKETVKSIKYETSWFNIWNVTNINTIKVIDEVNGSNADTIYINGSDSAIKTKLVGGLSGRYLSRRFDIEMKDMFVYTYNSGEQKYEKVKIKIPMLFVQNDFINSFSEDFYDKNADTGAINPTNISMNSNDSTYMFAEYSSLINEYLEIKEQATYQSINEYIGTKDAYFD